MMLDQLLGLLAPHICLGCGSEGSVLCSSCTWQYHEPVQSRCASCHRLTEDFRVCQSCRSWLDLYAVYVCGVYEGIYEQLVKSLKFDLKRDAAKPMAQLMADLLHDQDVVLCPVPTAPARVRNRGFDHALYITKELSRSTKLPYQQLLDRRSNVRQLGSSRKTRIRQMSEEFILKNAQAVMGKKIIIVDDVMTTGSTIAAISQVLKQGGAKRVSAVVFAQHV